MRPDQIIGVMPFNRIDSVLHACVEWCSPAPLSASELLAEIAALARESGVVFPSHFFEHPERAVLLNALSDCGSRTIRFQVSPGAELAFLKDDLLSLRPDRFGVDLVFDRNPHPADVAILDELTLAGLALRWIYVPRRSIPLKQDIARFPDWLREKLLLLIPEARKSDELRYSYDEAMLLCRELAKAGLEPAKKAVCFEIPLAPETPGLFLGASLSHGYALSPERYKRDFSELGPDRALRAAVKTVSQTKSGSAALDVLEHSLQLLYEPSREGYDRLRESSMAAWRMFCASCRAILWKLWYLTIEKPFWLLYELFWLFTELLWLLTRVYWILHSACWKLYSTLKRLVIWIKDATWHAVETTLFVTSEFVKSPAGAARYHFPVLYWVAFHPVLKVYWFAEFQIRKRLLK